MFFHFLSFSFIFSHFLSSPFIFFHVRSCSFIFVHFRSFSFILISFSFIVFFLFFSFLFFFFFLLVILFSRVLKILFLPRLPHDFLLKLLCKKSFFLAFSGVHLPLGFFFSSHFHLFDFRSFFLKKKVSSFFILFLFFLFSGAQNLWRHSRIPW